MQFEHEHHKATHDLVWKYLAELFEELHLRLSESKSDQAALQARFEAEALATSDESEKTAEVAIEFLRQARKLLDGQPKAKKNEKPTARDRYR